MAKRLYIVISYNQYKLYGTSIMGFLDYSCGKNNLFGNDITM